MKITKIALATLLILNLAACKKDAKDPEPETVTPPPASTPTTPAPITSSTGDMKKDILVELSWNVIYTSYTDMSNKANIMYTNLLTFKDATNSNNLALCRNNWKEVRSAWEQTEGFLFGPVSVDNIDPRIDTWPIDFARMDSVLVSTEVFTNTYIDGLEESLKGFHPLEYLLFGQDGTKNETQFTARQKELMIALALNIKSLCDKAKTSWDPATADNYNTKFSTAGAGNVTYGTQRAAYEELIDAMSGICDEVANGKIKDPFDAVDPTLEESPFAKNSIIDFTNNIKSVQNIYLGKYVSDGKGLEDLIKANNISMDGTIKTKINSAITSLNNITIPFGQAISNTGGQRTQVQNAVNAINDLKDYLDGDVKTYVKTQVN